ncbi:hypothetical protein GIB67_009394, partial [Kingdonia uniflora]
EEKKTEEKKAEEKKPEGEEKKTEEPKETPPPPPPPPPPPQEIVLKVYMHCEGCARKVKKCLKWFPGVEDVLTDCKSSKVIVKGEKADPMNVLKRVEKKTRRKVELLSPIPKPPVVEEAKKVEEEKPKPEEKKEEPPVVITVVLKVHMHCDNCALEMQKRIMRMKGVESAKPDLNSSQVTVRGIFDPAKLVEFVYKRTGKRAVIVSQPEKKKEEEKPKEEKKEENGEKGKEGEKEEKKGEEEAKAAEEETKVELNRNEFYYYPQRDSMEYHYPTPHLFSDENPNGCSIM